MAGEYGKNREYDFAYWANLGGKKRFAGEEAEGLTALLGHCRYHGGVEKPNALDMARVQSENLYRVACLLAYGSGLASVCDIEDFARITEVTASVDSSADGFLEEHAVDTKLCVEVTLPYLRMDDGAELPGSEIIRTPKMHHGILQPDKPTFLFVEHSIYEREGYQTYAMFCYPDISIAKQDGWYEWREAYGVIGRVIANAHTLANYIGVYDGKPLFEARCGFDTLWQTIAELSDKQAPGICPVCGKVIDRRRGKSGGKPKNTCAAHTDKFHNMKKKLQKGDNPRMKFSDECEEAVRQQRWVDRSLDERPLWLS